MFHLFQQRSFLLSLLLDYNTVQTSHCTNSSGALFACTILFEGLFWQQLLFSRLWFEQTALSKQACADFCFVSFKQNKKRKLINPLVRICKLSFQKNMGFSWRNMQRSYCSCSEFHHIGQIIMTKWTAWYKASGTWGVLALTSLCEVYSILSGFQNEYTCRINSLEREKLGVQLQHHYPNGQKDERLPRQNELNVNVTLLQRINLLWGGSKYKYRNRQTDQAKLSLFLLQRNNTKSLDINKPQKCFLAPPFKKHCYFQLGKQGQISTAV